MKALNDVVDAPAIAISKNAPGSDTAPPVAAGEDAVFDITVENIGTTDLSNVVVSDPAAPDCEQPVPDLAPGSIHTFTCSAPTDPRHGGDLQRGEVTADGPGGIVVSESDSSTVPGLVLGVSLTKLTNDIDVDVDGVPEVPAGSVVEWTYVVENVGQGDLTDLVVEDFPEGFANCPATTLAEGATVTCTLEGAAVVGEYGETTATAFASGTGGLTVEASDSSGYVGVAGDVAGSGLVRFATGGARPSSAPASPARSRAARRRGRPLRRRWLLVAVEGGGPGQFRVDVATVVDGVPLSSTRSTGPSRPVTDSVVLDPIELPNPATSQLFDLRRRRVQ